MFLLNKKYTLVNPFFSYSNTEKASIRCISFGNVWEDKLCCNTQMEIRSIIFKKERKKIKEVFVVFYINSIDEDKNYVEFTVSINFILPSEITYL